MPCQSKNLISDSNLAANGQVRQISSNKICHMTMRSFGPSSLSGAGLLYNSKDLPSYNRFSGSLRRTAAQNTVVIVKRCIRLLR